MRRDRTLTWFHRLGRGHQAALLANPHGYVPEKVAREIPKHTILSRRNESTRHPEQWLLHSAEANLLEDERHRLDKWWRELPVQARSALVDSRGGKVPREHREAVLDLIPGGVRPGTDLDVAFEMPAIAAAYLEMLSDRD
jgi:hypothetical protein